MEMNIHTKIYCETKELGIEIII